MFRLISQLTRTRNSAVVFSIASLLLVVASTELALAQRGYRSDSNGVYGGYVGSDRWFDSMRKVPGGNGAAALTRQQQLEEAALNAGTHTQVALQVVLVGGNRFPKGQLPGLAILNANGQATGLVARLAQSSNQDAVYHMILKNGTRYGFQWMYYLGQRETFGWLTVPANAGRQMVAAIQYRPSTPAARANPSNATVFVRGSNGYVPPQSDKSWTPPQTGTPYQPPTTGKPYRAPTAQPANSNSPPQKCNPNIPRYSQPNCVP